MQIDIISDTVCPWCYVGKRRLEAAIARRPDLTFSLHWLPFELNPDMPPSGADRREHYAAKFGDGPRAAHMQQALEEAGRDAGIAFDFHHMKRIPNTRGSHRLIMWAESAGVQNKIVEALFKAYFLEGRDIGDHAVLTAIAAAAGMDGEIVATLLAEGVNADAIEELEAVARRMGVTGVPCFIVNRKYALVGAQDSEAFLQLFERVEAEEKAAQA